MRSYKVFIQAVRQGDAGREERMFKYDEQAPDPDAARQAAKVAFEMESALQGWTPESIGVLEFPG